MLVGVGGGAGAGLMAPPDLTHHLHWGSDKEGSSHSSTCSQPSVLASLELGSLSSLKPGLWSASSLVVAMDVHWPTSCGERIYKHRKKLNNKDLRVVMEEFNLQEICKEGV